MFVLMKIPRYFLFSLDGITHSTLCLPLSSQGELGEIGLDGLDGEEVSDLTSQGPLFTRSKFPAAESLGTITSRDPLSLPLQGDKGLPGSSGEKGSPGRRVGVPLSHCSLGQGKT